MASKRASILATRRARSGSTSRRVVSDSRNTGRPGSRCQWDRGRPVHLHTSSARTMRWVSVGISRAAVSGSRSVQHGVQLGRGPPCRFRAPVGTRPGLNRRHRRQALQQCAEVEPGTADDDGHAAGGTRARNGDRSIRRVAPGGIGLGTGHEAVQRVRRPCLLRVRGPCREDTQLAVHLHAVAVDDGAVQPLGKRKRKAGLAAGGRPGDQDRAAGGAAWEHDTSMLRATGAGKARGTDGSHAFGYAYPRRRRAAVLGNSTDRVRNTARPLHAIPHAALRGGCTDAMPPRRGIRGHSASPSLTAPRPRRPQRGAAAAQTARHESCIFRQRVDKASRQPQVSASAVPPQFPKAPTALIYPRQ